MEVLIKDISDVRLLKSAGKKEKGSSHCNRIIHQNEGASVSSAFIWKGLSLSIRKLGLLAGAMLLKTSA